jgi:hypothetical protein
MVVSAQIARISQLRSLAIRSASHFTRVLAGYHSREWRPTISAIPAIAFAFGELGFRGAAGFFQQQHFEV